MACLSLSHCIEILFHIAVQHQIGIAQRVIVDQVVQLAVLASGVNNLFPTGVMNHFLSETHSQF